LEAILPVEEYLSIWIYYYHIADSIEFRISSTPEENCTPVWRVKASYPATKRPGQIACGRSGHINQLSFSCQRGIC
jgi:hypothetical protein